jgi:hypothetical protein
MVPPARACTRLVDSKSARFGRDAERALVGTGAWVGGSGRVPDGGSYASSTREPPPQHTHRLQVCQTHAPPSQHSAGCGSHGSARRASQYTHRYRCRSSSHPRVLCVHRWRDANPRSKGVTPLVLADASRSKARHLALRSRLQDPGDHTSCTQPASLCRRAVPLRRLPKTPGMGKKGL